MHTLSLEVIVHAAILPIPEVSHLPRLAQLLNHLLHHRNCKLTLYYYVVNCELLTRSLSYNLLHLTFQCPL